MSRQLPPWSGLDIPRSAPSPPREVRSPVLLYDTRKDTQPMDQDSRDQLAGDITQLYREKYGDTGDDDTDSADFLTAAMRPASSIYSVENQLEPQDDEEEDEWVDDVRMSSAEQTVSESQNRQEQTLQPPRGPSVYKSIYDSYLAGSVQIPSTPGLPIRNVQAYSVAHFDMDPTPSRATRPSMAGSARYSDTPLPLLSAGLYSVAEVDGAPSPLLSRSSTFPRGKSTFAPTPLVLNRHGGSTARRSGEKPERASPSRSITSPGPRGGFRNSDTAAQWNSGRVSRGSESRSDKLASPRSDTSASWRSEARSHRVVSPRSVTSARGGIRASFTLSPRIYAGVAISMAPTDRWCEEMGVRPRDRLWDRETVVKFRSGEVDGRSVSVRKSMKGCAARLAVLGQTGWR